MGRLQLHIQSPKRNSANLFRTLWPSNYEFPLCAYLIQCIQTKTLVALTVFLSPSPPPPPNSGERRPIRCGPGIPQGAGRHRAGLDRTDAAAGSRPFRMVVSSEHIWIVLLRCEQNFIRMLLSSASLASLRTEPPPPRTIHPIYINNNPVDGFVDPLSSSSSQRSENRLQHYVYSV